MIQGFFVVFYLGFGWAKIGLDLFFFFGTIGGSASPASSLRSVGVRNIGRNRNNLIPRIETLRDDE